MLRAIIYFIVLMTLVYFKRRRMSEQIFSLCCDIEMFAWTNKTMYDSCIVYVYCMARIACKIDLHPFFAIIFSHWDSCFGILVLPATLAQRVSENRDATFNSRCWVDIRWDGDDDRLWWWWYARSFHITQNICWITRNAIISNIDSITY